MAIGAGIHWWTSYGGRPVSLKGGTLCCGTGMHRYHLGAQSNNPVTWLSKKPSVMKFEALYSCSSTEHNVRQSLLFTRASRSRCCMPIKLVVISKLSLAQGLRYILFPFIHSSINARGSKTLMVFPKEKKRRKKKRQLLLRRRPIPSDSRLIQVSCHDTKSQAILVFNLRPSKATQRRSLAHKLVVLLPFWPAPTLLALLSD